MQHTEIDGSIFYLPGTNTTVSLNIYWRYTKTNIIRVTKQNTAQASVRQDTAQHPILSFILTVLNMALYISRIFIFKLPRYFHLLWTRFLMPPLILLS
jgi:hypothetical protein